MQKDIGKTGRRLGDRFREHLRGVEKQGRTQTVARKSNLPDHSNQPERFSFN